MFVPLLLYKTVIERKKNTILQNTFRLVVLPQSCASGFGLISHLSIHVHKEKLLHSEGINIEYVTLYYANFKTCPTT